MQSIHLSNRLFIGLVAAAFTAPGCVTSRTGFLPSTQNGGAVSSGAAAYYAVSAGDRKVGDAKVWSTGVHPAGTSASGAVLHVGVRVRNASKSDLELVLSQADVDLVMRNGDLLVLDNGLRKGGAGAIPPGTLQRFELYFPVPEEVSLKDVESFEFNWMMRVDGRPFMESTVFEPRPDPNELSPGTMAQLHTR